MQHPLGRRGSETLKRSTQRLSCVLEVQQALTHSLTNTYVHTRHQKKSKVEDEEKDAPRTRGCPSVRPSIRGYKSHGELKAQGSQASKRDEDEPVEHKEGE